VWPVVAACIVCDVATRIEQLEIQYIRNSPNGVRLGKQPMIQKALHFKCSNFNYQVSDANTHELVIRGLISASRRVNLSWSSLAQFSTRSRHWSLLQRPCFRSQGSHQDTIHVMSRCSFLPEVVDQLQKPSNPTFDHAGFAIPKCTKILKIKWEASESLHLAHILQRNAIIFNPVPGNTDALSKIRVLGTGSKPSVATREVRGEGTSTKTPFWYRVLAVKMVGCHRMPKALEPE
jgi:hypothetical protein